MFRRQRTDKLKETAVDASRLAVELAQDKRFRKRLVSAIEHSLAAKRRATRGRGLAGVVQRLNSDQTLLRELKSARHDLEQARARLERKRRSHKLRNLLLLGSLASFVGIPALRRRVAAILGAVKPGEASEPADGDRRLEDMTKEELYAAAQEADIPGRSEMSKEQLVEALRSRGSA
jgi:hypothetical protein